MEVLVVSQSVLATAQLALGWLNALNVMKIINFRMENVSLIWFHVIPGARIVLQAQEDKIWHQLLVLDVQQTVTNVDLMIVALSVPMVTTKIMQEHVFPARAIVSLVRMQIPVCDVRLAISDS